MTKKYELTNETKNGLYRIQALRDIPHYSIKAGDLGGWIASERNLSQEGDAWVSGDAKVYGDARVSGNAVVSGEARVFDNALVSGNAWVSDNARVCDNALIYKSAYVYGNAKVYGYARVFDSARVYGSAQIFDSARVYGQAQVSIGKINKTEMFTTHYLQYPITVTPYEIRIGCETKPRKGKDTWSKVTLEQAMEMGLNKENYKEMRRVLKSLTGLIKKGN